MAGWERKAEEDDCTNTVVLAIDLIAHGIKPIYIYSKGEVPEELMEWLSFNVLKRRPDISIPQVS
jgi:hypothetical protein